MNILEIDKWRLDDLEDRPEEIIHDTAQRDSNQKKGGEEREREWKMMWWLVWETPNVCFNRIEKKKIENRAEATFESKITADFPELVEDSGNPTNPKQGNKREIQHKDLS